MENIKIAFTFRAFSETDADYDTIVAIHNQVYTDDKVTLDQYKFSDKTRNKDPKYPHHRVIISNTDGQAIGYGEYMQSEGMYHPQKYFWEVYVADGQDVATVGDAFHDYVLEQLADKDLIALITATRDDKTDYMTMFENAGYQLLMRYPQSHLMVADFDASKFEAQVKRVRDAGIRIITATQLQQEKPDDWQSIIHELEWTLMQDVPMPDPPQKRTLENFIEAKLKNPAFLMDGYFLAVDEDEYVGMSNLWTDLADPTRLWTGLTGVVRSHRRKSIASVLKVHAVNYAKSAGVKTIQTDNEENNPMYDLNMQLGYTPLPAWVDYEKSLEPSST